MKPQRRRLAGGRHAAAAISAQTALVARAKAWELRKVGLSEREIARQIGVSPATAHRYIARVVDELKADTLDVAREYRAVQLERLEDMYVRLQALLSSQSPGVKMGAIDRAVKLLERTSRLLGLDAPTRNELEVDGCVSLVEMVKAVESGRDAKVIDVTPID